MSRIGAIAAAPFLGGQFVSLYLGATRVPTVPGAPTWDGPPLESGGDQFGEPFDPPENDGGSEITEYNFYVDGELMGASGIENVDVTLGSPGTYEIAVAAVNAVGEGPRLTVIYEYVED